VGVHIGVDGSDGKMAALHCSVFCRNNGGHQFRKI
jgi:hypothetical protein